ncbi:hypothetical protein V5799_033352 [Amblyomma americanum]|uniref:Uncharacterized protein n=1 Tax=Amblyomma americanum TaxID=6943 RepID=A0AAQ4DNJ9_AMBAM
MLAVLTSRATCDGTVAEIEKMTKSWFRHAKERMQCKKNSEITAGVYTNLVSWHQTLRVPVSLPAFLDCQKRETFRVTPPKPSLSPPQHREEPAGPGPEKVGPKLAVLWQFCIIATPRNAIATTTQRGYDPTAMAWPEIDIQQPEDRSPSIEDDGLFKLISMRKRTQRFKTCKDGTTMASLKQTQAAGLNGRLFSSSDRAALPLDNRAALWRPKGTPKMSSEDIIVDIKPRQTMNLKGIFQHGELGAAIAQYVGGDAGAALSIWPVWTQNLVVCGTQHIEAANKLTKDFDLNTGADSHPFRGHVKINGEVCRGVIKVRADETKASLKNKVKWREGEIAFVRKLGKSNVAVLTFVGRKVPRYVHYNCEWTLVREYKRTIPACFRCGTIGHRVATAHTRTSEGVDFAGNMWALPGRVLKNVTVPHAA